MLQTVHEKSEKRRKEDDVLDHGYNSFTYTVNKQTSPDSKLQSFSNCLTKFHAKLLHSTSLRDHEIALSPSAGWNKHKKLITEDSVPART